MHLPLRPRQVQRVQADVPGRARARLHPQPARREGRGGGDARCDLHLRRAVRLEAFQASQRTEHRQAPQVAGRLAG